MISKDEFKKKALEQGFSEEDVNKYINQQSYQSLAEQSQSSGNMLADEYYRQLYSAPPAPFANQTQSGIKTVSAKGAPITQQFGNYNPNLYRGINKSMRNTGVDFGYKQGSPVALPPGQWEVIEVGKGYNRGYGNSILVRNSQTGEKLRFSHLSKMAQVRQGQVVGGNGVIALTGATGNVTGPHLDLEYYTPQGQVASVLRSPYGGYY